MRSTLHLITILLCVVMVYTQQNSGTYNNNVNTVETLSQCGGSTGGRCSDDGGNGVSNNTFKGPVPVIARPQSSVFALTKYVDSSCVYAQEYTEGTTRENTYFCEGICYTHDLMCQLVDTSVAASYRYRYNTTTGKFDFDAFENEKCQGEASYTESREIGTCIEAQGCKNFQALVYTVVPPGLDDYYPCVPPLEDGTTIPPPPTTGITTEDTTVDTTTGGSTV